MIAGYATSTATAKYHERHAEVASRTLGKHGVVVSQAGFGCYRIEPQSHAHHAALAAALTNGINLVDTSTNYGDGGSERLVGHQIALQVAAGQIVRQEMVVVSKVGYLQGSNFDESRKRKAAGEAWPELVEYGPGLEHCIHPEFIAAQLTASLERLGLETIDVYLLHNPEYYLGWAAEREAPLAPIREVYYDRIRRAFEHLEREVAANRIRCYGVSSNSFAAPVNDAQMTDLSRLCDIADAFGNDNHFAVIQLPFNLIEAGAAIERNQPGGETVLELAARRNIAVLVNRPLNAIAGNQLLRLAAPPDIPVASAGDVDSALEKLIALEIQFQQNVMPSLAHAPEIVNQLGQYLMAGQVLQGRWITLGSYQQWRQTLSTFLMPRLNAAYEFLQRPGNLDPQHARWLADYFNAVDRAFSHIDGVYAQLAREEVSSFRERVARAVPDWLAANLSQTALRALRKTIGVTSVLVGMRQPAYVADVLDELHRPAALDSGAEEWEQFLATAQSSD